LGGNFLFEDGVMTKLSDKKCVPCKGGVERVAGRDLLELLGKIDGEWNVVEDRCIERTFLFKDFREALNFTNTIGEIAEQQGHHPDVFLAWGQVKLSIRTHSINGLTESDFILAAKIDQVVEY
jgi:4a-hydroxytetrahydrobiopterin dehydratase